MFERQHRKNTKPSRPSGFPQLPTGLTRRQFVMEAGTLGAIGLTAGIWSRSGLAAPKRGGSVKFGVAGGAISDSLDPRGAPDTHLALTQWATRNSLTEVKETGELVGEIAESWDASPDAKAWAFKIRKGVEFHNGKTLTAKDVAASLNIHRGEDTKSGGKVLLESVVDIKVDDSHTIVFELENGNADFPFLLSDYHLLILPTTDGKVDWESGVGTGGYILEQFEPGTTVKLNRNPNYFKGDDRAHFEQVELLNIADATSRQTALITGDVDAIGRVDIKTAALLADVEDIRVIETTGSQYSTIPMDTRVAPFDNLDVRMAMKYAINREELLRTVLRGHGAIGNDHPIGPTYRYHAQDLEQRSYDPERAKFHLKKAGFERLKVELQTSEVAWPAGAVDAAVLYVEHAKAAGIEIEVVRKPSDGYWSNTWTKVPLCMGYIGGRPTEDWVFTAFYASDAHYNDTHWKNDRFDQLLVQGRSELDDAKRRVIYQEMQLLLRDDGGLIVPLFTNHIVATSDKISTGEHVSGNWEMDNWRAVERWSLA
jgi:peptide/nickel transport system substrate-binding protein